MWPEWVAKYIGIPFKDKGREVTGVDCWGIPYLIFRNYLGIELPLYLDQYGNSMDKVDVSALVNKEKGFWQRVNQPQLYDVIVFRLRGVNWHVGLVLDKRHFLHCIEGSNSCVENYKSSKWRHRIEGFYRYAGNNE